MSKDITRMIFNAWMEQYHPNFYLAWGLIYLAETALFIFGLAGIFFLTWWLKLLIFNVGLAAVTWFIRKGHDNIIGSQFASGEYPLKGNNNG